MKIVIEGLDASGKATQSKLLAERLKGTCITVPDYSTETGKAILGNLKKEWCATGLIKPTALRDGPPGIDRQAAVENNKLNALVFQALMIINRYEMVPRISEALKRGPVILDRWTQSSTVYGVCSGLDPEWCERVQASLPQADVNILIDVPVEEGFKRRPERRDRHETDRPFLEKVRVEYLKMWGMNKWGNAPAIPYMGGVFSPRGDNWIIINGLGTIEEIHEHICAVLRVSPGDK